MALRSSFKPHLYSVQSSFTPKTFSKIYANDFDSFEGRHQTLHAHAMPLFCTGLLNFYSGVWNVPGLLLLFSVTTHTDGQDFTKKVRKKQERWKKIAKVATKNRQNRHMAEFRESFKMRVAEHQILCGKVVSQARFKPPSPNLD